MCQILKGFFTVFCVSLVALSSAFGQEFGSKPIIRKVVTQDKQEFQATVRDAFSQYLTLMSGNSAVSELPKVAQLIKQADKYLLEFRYERLAESDLEIVSEFDQTEQARWKLKLQFDYRAVEQHLFNIGAPIWPSPRPQLMVWLAYESNDGLRTIVSSNELTAEDYKSQLRALASDRGLRLKYPVYDDEDRQLFSESALWGLFQEDLIKASSIYQLRNSVAVRVYPTGNETWQYQAILSMPNGVRSIEGITQTQQQAVTFSVEQAIDLMSANYALQVDPNDKKEVVLNVESISNFDQLKYLVSDLSAILMVKDIVPATLKGNDVSLRMDVVGDEALLKLTLANQPNLVEKIEVEAPDSISKEPEQPSTIDANLPLESPIVFNYRYQTVEEKTVPSSEPQSLGNQLDSFESESSMTVNQ